MEIASQISPKIQKRCIKTLVIGITSLKTTNICFFLIILETAHGSHFWSVPSQFQIFWSLDCQHQQNTMFLLSIGQRRESGELVEFSRGSGTFAKTAVEERSGVAGWPSPGPMATTEQLHSTALCCTLLQGTVAVLNWSVRFCYLMVPVHVIRTDNQG